MHAKLQKSNIRDFEMILNLPIRLSQTKKGNKEFEQLLNAIKISLRI